MVTIAQAQTIFPGRVVTHVWKGLDRNVHIFFEEGESVEIRLNDDNRWETQR